MNNNLSVKVLSINEGIIEFNNIKFIRIISEKYNLLIMRDYIPIIGEVNGNIEIQGETMKKYSNIKGYYINRNNEFTLIIKEEL